MTSTRRQQNHGSEPKMNAKLDLFVTGNWADVVAVLGLHHVGNIEYPFTQTERLVKKKCVYEGVIICITLPENERQAESLETCLKQLGVLRSSYEKPKERLVGA